MGHAWIAVARVKFGLVRSLARIRGSRPDRKKGAGRTARRWSVLPVGVWLITQVDRRAITLLIGEGNYARRFQHFVKNYPEIIKRSPQARIFDLRLDDRITVKE